MKDEKFYKKEDGDVIWWVDTGQRDGEFLFSFDKQKVYNLFRDYPQNMTAKQIATFDRECPFWANFFKDRKKQK